MGTREALDRHLAAPHGKICEVARSPLPDNPEDGISVRVRELFTKRREGVNINTWEAIWRALFPNDYDIPSPGEYRLFVLPVHR